MEQSKRYNHKDIDLQKIKRLIFDYLSNGNAEGSLETLSSLLAKLLNLIEKKKSFFIGYEDDKKWLQFLRIFELSVLLSIKKEEPIKELVVCGYILSVEYKKVVVFLQEPDMIDPDVFANIPVFFREELGVFEKDFFEGYGVNSRSKIVYNFYKDKLSPCLEKLREKQGRLEKGIREEVNDILKEQAYKVDSLEEKIQRIYMDIVSFNKTKSFTSAYEGLDVVKNNAQDKLNHLNYVSYGFIFLIFMLLMFLLLFSIGLTCDYLGVGCYRKVYGDSLKTYFWSQEARVSVVSITMVFVSIYFFRVFNHRANVLESLISKVEFKAAITSFQLGYLDVVEEKKGDVKESIRRYEEFLYSTESNDQDSAPQITDNVTELLKEIKGMVKK